MHISFAEGYGLLLLSTGLNHLLIVSGHLAALLLGLARPQMEAGHPALRELAPEPAPFNPRPVPDGTAASHHRCSAATDPDGSIGLPVTVPRATGMPAAYVQPRSGKNSP